MSRYPKWKRLDGGAEGKWAADTWRKVLAIAKGHEGTKFASGEGDTSPFDRDVEAALPRLKASMEGGRALFRGWQQPWTKPGLLRLEKGVIEITDLGNQFLRREISGAEVLLRFFESYVDEHAGVKPFAVLCHALLEARRPLSFTELYFVSQNYRPGEDILDILDECAETGMAPSETEKRAFRAFLVRLTQAGVIVELGEGEHSPYEIWNKSLAERVASTLTSEAIAHLRGQNRIFYGPPGTGKSYQADQVAKSCIPHRALFHPEYTHAQFVGMLRPVVGYQLSEKKEIFLHDGNSTDRPPFTYFSFVPGVFSRGLVDAYNAFAEGRHVALIIDEINRGDCAAIFGDIFQLLDRNEAGFSQYGISISEEMRAYLNETTRGQWDVRKDGLLYLPANFSILATMTTSDQSLYPMDSAFKRRWEWTYVPIEFLGEHARWTLTDCSGSWDWPGLVASINQWIVADRQEDKQIGPWFVRADSEGQIPEDVFANKVLFYLWHDIWSEEIGGAGCPFELPSGAESFGELQRIFRQKGLKEVFKKELWERLQKPSEEGSADSTDPGE